MVGFKFVFRLGRKDNLCKRLLIIHYVPKARPYKPTVNQVIVVGTRYIASYKPEFISGNRNWSSTKGGWSHLWCDKGMIIWWKS